MSTIQPNTISYAKYTTTDKSYRNINQQFDQRQFNNQFEEKIKIIDQQVKLNESQDIQLDRDHEIIGTKLPHKKPIEDIIINIRELFYDILLILQNGQNPYQYIFASPDRQFAFSIGLIVIGTLLLLFSNLMK
jgi:hypothetical protein